MNISRFTKPGQTRSLSKKIVKAMGIFGGVKLLTILCSLIRNKLIAVFVGPIGMGLISLYNSVLDMAGTAARLSIDQSALRDIAKSSAAEAPRTARVVAMWSKFLGVVGAVVLCALSPMLSLWAFDTTERWWTFAVVSPVIPFVAIANSRIVVMQGLNHLADMAKASATGAVAGLVVTVPLIFLMRENSLLLVLLILLTYGFVTMAGAYVYRVRLERVRVSIREAWKRGGEFIKLGIYMTASTFIAQLLNYIFITYLNRAGSTEILGQYQAGYTLVNTYVGVLFTGIWAEYYPRLMRVIHSPRRTSAIVTHEIFIAISVMAPVVTMFITFDDLIVKILYSSTFIDILPYISIGVIGVILRALSWCLAFTILARGDGHVYIISETLSAVIGLVLNVTMYAAWGFGGLGVSYILWYAAYTVITLVIYRRRYGLTLPWRTVRFSVAIIAVATVTLLLKAYVGWYAALPIATLTILLPVRALMRR